MKKLFVKNWPSRFSASLILFLALFVFISPRHPLAQSKNQAHRFPSAESSTGGDGDEAGYIIVSTKDGITCRQMTADEAAQLKVDQVKTDLRPISENRVDAREQQNLKIVLRGTSQLEQFPAAKEAFLRAAAKWEAIIQSPITVVIDVDFGPTIFGTTFPSASIIGSTNPQVVGDTNFLATVRNYLITGSSSARQAEIFSALPTSLPTDLGPTATVLSSASVFRALGDLPAVADPTGELSQLGPPPSIGFNSNFTFDLDPSDGIDPDKTDFEAAAIHEIGHALGFISNVGGKELTPSSSLAPTIWDFYRFRPGGLTTSSIAGSARVQLAGGEQSFFVGDMELPLSTSTGQGTGGDGRQASHWKDNSLIGQYVGVMDPTEGAGERMTITAADLTALSYFGYKINPNASITEILSVDDGSREDSLSIQNAWVVNRYTPARYPASLQAVRVYIPPTTDGSSAVGQSIRIIAFADPNRTGQPPANPTLIVDRTLNIPTLPGTRFVEVVLQTPPAVNSGDLYVGIQSLSATVPIAADRTGRQQNRSFISTNNGASFQPLQNPGNAPVNFMSRIVLTETYGTTAAPALASISPSSVAPGSAAFGLVVQGANFQSSSVVRWNGNDRQTTLINGTQLQAAISAADVAGAGTAKVTVFTTGSGESAPLNFTIGANRPLPIITRLSPSTYAVGISSPLKLDVFGADFTPQSVIRFNGTDRATTLANSTQLSATLQPTDLAAAGDNKITVFTPGPGGGTSNEVTFVVNNCSYALSLTSQNFISTITGSGTTGLVLNTTLSTCPWTAVSNVPWLTISNPPSGIGAGKFVINYQIASNTSPDVRSGTVSIAGQTLNVRQNGRATSVSAASFAAPLAPNAIGAVFGVGLAKAVQSAPTQPLPTNLGGTVVNVIDSAGVSRAAGLFFVSPQQVNFLIPAATAAGSATVRVVVDGTSMADGVVTINASAPSLFAANANGSGLAAAVVLRVKADNTQIFEPATQFDAAQNKFVPVPIDFGAETDRIFLLLYGSGIRGRSALTAVSVQAGGTAALVSYAGPQSDFAGLDQINAELPRSLKGRGEITVNLTVDGRTANAVTVTIK
ncbi:MAG: NF038122 family metalloprotease [Acidobacteriota bacterium]